MSKMVDVVIEFYHVGAEKPAAMIVQSGDPSIEGTDNRLGVLSKVKLLSEMLNNIEGGKAADPEWAAAEYITLFRKLADPSIKVLTRRRPTAQFLCKVTCASTGLKPTLLAKEQGDTFKRVA